MAAPNPPTLSLANDGDGDAITATVAGDAGVTTTLYYAKDADAALTAGSSRVGDGDIAQAGLDNNAWYVFVAVSNNGENSIPSKPVSIFVTDASSSTPLGEWSLAMSYLKNLLAYSPTFQTWVGATEPTEAARVVTAKTHIYETGFGKDEAGVAVASLRPYAIVVEGDPADWRRNAQTGGARHHFLGAGALDVFFEADVDSGDNTVAKAERAFKNKIGVIVAEMEERCGNSDSAFLFTHTSIAHGPARAWKDEAQDDDGGDYFQCIVRFAWGIE